MPAIADLTVKKYDGTTNIVYSGVQPSSGDGTPAVWKSQTVGTANAHQPEFRLAAKEGSNGAKRNSRVTFQYPQIATNTTTGVTSVIDRFSADVNVSCPKGMTQSDINEAVAQLTNILATTLIRDCLRQGYAAS